MNTSELKSKLSKAQEFLKGELSQIRTGRASPSLLEGILVEAYGTKMTIIELASVMVSDSQNLVVTPWDKTLIKSIAKAIREFQPSLNPVEESDRIRVPVPLLTEERRKEMARMVGVKVEECKNAIRNIRQEAMKDIDKMFSDKAIGEDEKFRFKEEVEKIVKEYSDGADEIGEVKKKEILTV
ncbi:MAG: ribosome-recycling factor [Patescibacteria group bacterium]|nr:MAG: ribosome-recycling factor [Patescibacteria group bacterium]